MSKHLLIVLCICLVNSLEAGDWPQWRGPNRTDVSAESGLLESWPKGGPERVWLFREAGIGYSGFAIVDGTLYTMGAVDGVEYVIAVDAKTGKRKWRSEVGDLLENGWGDGPRGTPTVDGPRLYALGGRGNLVCLRTSDGEQIWERSMKEFGGKIPGWGYTESVLVDGSRVVCTPGGKKGAMVALDKKSGELRWQSSEFKDGAQYSSIIAADHNGTRQYIQLVMKKLVGIDAETGKLLWESPWPGRTAVIPTPIFDDGKVYITSGYGVGCKLVEIGPDNRVRDVWVNKVMKNHHGGVIKVGDYLYGYSNGVGWACQSFETGKLIWNEKSHGKGAIAYADGMLYCLSEREGRVVLIEASPMGWKEHGSFELEPKTKLRKPRGRIWTHPVISNGRLYLRDQEIIYCYDVKK